MLGVRTSASRARRPPLASAARRPRYPSVMAVRRFVERDLPLVEQGVPERKISAVHRERLARQSQDECRDLLSFSNERPVGGGGLLIGSDEWSEWRVPYFFPPFKKLYISPP